MSFHSIEAIVNVSNNEKKKFWEVILKDDCMERDVTPEESIQGMEHMWQSMLDATYSYDRNLLSASGLVGKEGGLMEDYVKAGDTLSGEFSAKAIARALQMGGSNACMKRIVAAPTAGACGVMPAVLTTYYEEKKASKEDIVHALYVGAGIGQVIAHRAFIAGAAGGCQAEVGSASAMAAGALVALRGGSAEQISNACAIALKNLLGLVCDPVAGLVEVPCVKRNAVGAVNALAAADMALAGVTSAIPADQVIDAMRAVGESMDTGLRETGEGGLAATPKGREVARRLRGLADVDA
ncbi:MAG: L-serine ammonia-lyase, iron-sulfur-dependent, subunit alpha [Lachnospiraceae bacterium]|nr:L-serine ammonia-lyase, iron-sulfur-dependent, subunit alpha [Lachnospiraceae bacterium]